MQEAAEPCRRALTATENIVQAARERFDRRERIVELVAEHAHEALPGWELFLAEGVAEIADDDELVRAPAFAKGGATHSRSVRVFRGRLNEAIG